MKLVNAINNALDVAMEKDPTAGTAHVHTNCSYINVIACVRYFLLIHTFGTTGLYTRDYSEHVLLVHVSMLLRWNYF